MKRGIIFGLLLLFLVLITTKVVFASSSLFSVFGGRIINTKSADIEALEKVGYICPSFGSITIRTIGSPSGTPTSYFIDPGTSSKTGITPRDGQLIIGKYGGMTTVSCQYPATGEIRPVVLPTIKLFGNSRS